MGFKRFINSDMGFKRFVSEQTAGKIILRLENKNDGIAVQVAEVLKGFSVAIIDTDSNQALPTIKIFSDKNKAIQYAKELFRKL